MKTDNTLLALLLASAVAARPGSKWAGKFKELQQAAVEFDKRAPSAIRGPNDSDEMIGDLASPGPQTAIGQVCDRLESVIEAVADLGSRRSTTFSMALVTARVLRSTQRQSQLWAQTGARRTLAAYGSTLQTRCWYSSVATRSDATDTLEVQSDWASTMQVLGRRASTTVVPMVASS